MKNIVLSAILVAVSASASAVEYISGTVSTVEATYLPGTVTFTLDPNDSTASTTCPGGTWLKWSNDNAENNKAVYSMLMTALVSGKKVNFIINDGDTTCVGQFIHLLR